MGTDNTATDKPQRIVMKFGGTSMAGTERIRRVAGLVRRQAAGKDGTGAHAAIDGREGAQLARLAIADQDS